MDTHRTKHAGQPGPSRGSYFWIFSFLFFEKKLVREKKSKRETHTQPKVRARPSLRASVAAGDVAPDAPRAPFPPLLLRFLHPLALQPLGLSIYRVTAQICKYNDFWWYRLVLGCCLSHIPLLLLLI